MSQKGARRTAPTLRTVAARAGVDASTVSRVLNTSADERERWASAETVSRILRVAKELGYRRNPHGASLRTARSQLVGVIVPRLQDYVLATVFEGIDSAADEHGYAAFVTNSSDHPPQREARIEQLLDRRVDGLILCDSRTDDTVERSLIERQVPFVLASRTTGDHVGAFADDVLGGRLVADHLVSLGCRDPAIVAGPEFASTANRRVDGFRAGLVEHGLELAAKRVARTGFDADAGRAGATTLLGHGTVPDAVFATNDFAAIGVMGALREHGLRVPEDVVVVGYNDTPLAQNLPIPLTSVFSPMRTIGRTAFTLLASVMDGDKPVSAVFAPTLVARASTQIAPM